MTNFYYIGHLKENERFIRRRYRSNYKDYGDDRNTTCDFCNDVFDRIEMYFVTPEFDSNEDPEKVAWSIKLCTECITVIDHDHEIRNFKRLGVCKDEVDFWEQLNLQEEKEPIKNDIINKTSIPNISDLGIVDPYSVQSKTKRIIIFLMVWM